MRCAARGAGFGVRDFKGLGVGVNLVVRGCFAHLMTVIPAKAGSHDWLEAWVPACAGMIGEWVENRDRTAASTDTHPLLVFSYPMRMVTLSSDRS